MPRPHPETITLGPFSWTLPSWKIEGFWLYVITVLPSPPCREVQVVVVGVEEK